MKTIRKALISILIMLMLLTGQGFAVLAEEIPAAETDNAPAAAAEETDQTVDEEADAAPEQAAADDADEAAPSVEKRSITAKVVKDPEAGGDKSADILYKECRGADIVIEGMMPKDAYAEAYPVPAERIDIEDKEVVTAYDITIYVDGADGEKTAWQPDEALSVEIKDSKLEKEDSDLEIYHIADISDKKADAEFVTEAKPEDGSVAFDAESFSVYAVVKAPEPATLKPAKCKLSVNPAGTEKYFSNILNNKGAINEVTPENAAVWDMIFVEGNNKFYLRTEVDGTDKYLKNIPGDDDRSNKVAFVDSESDAALFESSSAGGGRYYIKVADVSMWLQHSNGGGGVRFWQNTGDGNNAKILITYIQEPTMEKDPYHLDGKSYGIVNANGGNIYAMMAEEVTASERTYMKQSGKLTVKDDPIIEGGILYITAQSSEEITLWQFQSVEEDIYYLKAGDAGYLHMEGSNITLVPEPEDCRIRVVPGTGSQEGKIHLLNEDKTKAIKKENSNFGLVTAGTGAQEWMTLADVSALDESDFVRHSARKVSISSEEVKDGDEVVLYTRVWNSQDRAYEFYVVDHKGSLVRAYESGDSIYWNGTAVNTMPYIFTEYYYEGTSEKNGYFELQNAYSGKYLAPQIGGRVYANGTVGVNMSGRMNGEYYSTILAWDDLHYDYAGLKSDIANKKLVSVPMAQAEHFYFAKMNVHDQETPTEPTEVATVDHEALGLTVKMVDFNGNVVPGTDGSGTDLPTSPTTQEQLDVMGTHAYSKDKAQPGLLSNGMGADGYPEASGGSLKRLFDNAVPVNNLFIQSIYDSSGYYEFDSTQNFAYKSGNKFKVYQELGTVSDSGNTRQHGQFMPYNDLDLGGIWRQNKTDIYGKQLSENYPRKNENLYKLAGIQDYYFGMEISGNFLMPPSGQDAWGHDLIFEFVGDDDFWLYVDGELVIDLGGIHQALPGSVNYSTGEVVVNGQHTYLYEIFKDHYKKEHDVGDDDAGLSAYLNGIFKTSGGKYVFKDYSTHDIRIFYMERGAGASNLRMRFNLAAVTPGQVLLSKEISGSDKQDYASASFPFQVFYDADGSGCNTMLARDTAGASVKYQGTGKDVTYKASHEVNGVTYENVYFLKPGETAAIKVPDDTISYKIKEVGVNKNIYNSAVINGDSVQGTERANGCYDYESTESTVRDRAKIVFTNHVDPDCLRSLIVTKSLKDAAGNELSYNDDNTGFRFRMYLGEGEEEKYYRLGEYHVKDPDGNYCTYGNNRFESTGETDYSRLSAEQKAAATFRTSPSGAVDKIPAGYCFEIRDLMPDTHFKVEERDSDMPKGYSRVKYVRKTVDSDATYIADEGEGGAPIYNSGRIRDSQENAQMTVENKRGWGLTAKKVWSDASFMELHDPIYVAVYAGETQASNVRQLTDSENETYWFFPTLESNKTFDQYEVREVKLTGGSINVADDGTVSGYTEVEPVDELTINATPKNGSEAEYTYVPTYSKGATEGGGSNVRTDTVTNLRHDGVVLRVRDWSGEDAVKGARFTLKKGDETVGDDEYTSDENGLITIMYDFTAGQTYTLTQTAAPNGYQGEATSLDIVVAEDGTVTATGSGDDTSWYNVIQRNDQDAPDGMAAVTVKNRKIQLQTVKTDGDTSQPLAGAHFALYKQVKDTSGSMRKDYQPMEGFEDIVTQSDGAISGVDETLRTGSYYLSETQVPSTYGDLGGDILITKDALGHISASGTTEEANGKYSLETSGEGSDSDPLVYTLTVKNYDPDHIIPTGVKARSLGLIFLLLTAALAAVLTLRKRVHIKRG